MHVHSERSYVHSKCDRDVIYWQHANSIDDKYSIMLEKHNNLLWWYFFFHWSGTLNRSVIASHWRQVHLQVSLH